MAEIKYSISFDAGAQMDLVGIINAKVAPLLSRSVNDIGQAVEIRWKDAVYNAKLWSRERDAYMDSIHWNWQPGSMSGHVEATYKHAAAIEDGRPARDLKKMLDTSSKVRRTKDGRRFLVIPLRHNTTGHGALAKAMPPNVNALAKQLAQSRVVGAGLRPVGEVTHLSPKTGMSPAAQQTPFLSNAKSKQHAMTAKMSYAWGDRISKAALIQAGASHAEAKRYAGMVRMDASTPGQKSSTYLTFRIMMDGQQGWVTKPQPGLKIAQKVTEEMKPLADKIFEEAVKRTFPDGNL